MPARRGPKKGSPGRHVSTRPGNQDQELERQSGAMKRIVLGSVAVVVLSAVVFVVTREDEDGPTGTENAAVTTSSTGGGTTLPASSVTTSVLPSVATTVSPARTQAGASTTAAATTTVARTASTTTSPTTPSTTAPSPTSTTGPSVTSTTAPLSGRPVLAAGGPLAATQLQATATCRQGQPGQAFASLSWVPAAQRGSEQRVQVTIYRDGFERGSFRVGAVLSPDRASSEWEPLEGQAIHYWRVLTLHSEGWRPSESGSFEGPTCPVDG